MVGGLIAGHLVVTEPEGRAGVIRCYGSPVNKCFSRGAFILGVNVTLSDPFVIGLIQFYDIMERLQVAPNPVCSEAKKVNE